MAGISTVSIQSHYTQTLKDFLIGWEAFCKIDGASYGRSELSVQNEVIKELLRRGEHKFLNKIYAEASK